MFVKMREVIDKEKAWWNCEELSGLNYYILFSPIIISLGVIIFSIMGFSMIGSIALIFLMIIAIAFSIIYNYYVLQNNSEVHISRDERVLIIKKVFKSKQFIYLNEVKGLAEYKSTAPVFIRFHYYFNGNKEEVLFCPETEPFLFFNSHPTYLRLKKLIEEQKSIA